MEEKTYPNNSMDLPVYGEAVGTNFILIVG